MSYIIRSTAQRMSNIINGTALRMTSIFKICIFCYKFYNMDDIDEYTSSTGQ